jgi:hypothetical protein
MAALFLEITPPVLLLMARRRRLDEGTAWWDVNLAVDSGSEVRPANQHTHSVWR